jgi:hypothetical protein
LVSAIINHGLSRGEDIEVANDLALQVGAQADEEGFALLV